MLLSSWCRSCTLTTSRCRAELALSTGAWQTAACRSWGVWNGELPGLLPGTVAWSHLSHLGIHTCGFPCYPCCWYQTHVGCRCRTEAGQVCCNLLYAHGHGALCICGHLFVDICWHLWTFRSKFCCQLPHTVGIHWSHQSQSLEILWNFMFSCGQVALMEPMQLHKQTSQTSPASTLPRWAQPSPPKSRRTLILQMSPSTLGQMSLSISQDYLRICGIQYMIIHDIYSIYIYMYIYIHMLYLQYNLIWYYYNIIIILL